jgi:hypothetical protein
VARKSSQTRVRGCSGAGDRSDREPPPTTPWADIVLLAWSQTPCEHNQIYTAENITLCVRRCLAQHIQEALTQAITNTRKLDSQIVEDYECSDHALACSCLTIIGQRIREQSP